jgi:hypothetical protein
MNTAMNCDSVIFNLLASIVDFEAIGASHNM